MSQFYHHEKIEKLRYDGPRPDYPQLVNSLWPVMENYLLRRQLDFTLAKDNGWYPTRYKGRRIVIPCSNLAGVPYFQARDMGDPYSSVRYISPSASRDDSIVLIIPQRIGRHYGCIGTVIVEGPMDALAAAAFGFLGIALMGNNPSVKVVDHIRSIVKGYFEPVLIVPDLDHLEMGPMLMADMAMNGIKGNVLIPSKKDLGDMTREQRRKFLLED